ncbi:hypothetical protein KFL_001530150 [Klebsormidium nitens]|uniref:Uncharacterized protein n=1 Tax=Klebsormidium nitens TaxID=105231 RepID=A0A1Y1HY36_KLENI|nr:hypothetical protein KFL_001530150 [Klebsormidium nitens]|eukprot:GAQ83574.1 hypothetical protein KFL_001530150 [Klebsormidium nitens]
MAEDVWKEVVDVNRAKSSLLLLEGPTRCAGRWPGWENVDISNCPGKGGDGGGVGIACIPPASQMRIRPDWGTLSFHRRILFLNGGRLDWRLVEGLQLKEVVNLGTQSTMQITLHEGRGEVKKSVAVSLHYQPTERNKANVAFANQQQNGESFTAGASYGLSPTLSLGATCQAGGPKRERTLELHLSNKGKFNSGTVTTKLKGREKTVRLQTQHGSNGGPVVKSSVSTTSKLATQWVIDAQLPITGRTSLAQKVSTDLRSKDRIEWKASHKRSDVLRFEAGLATDLKQERKLSADLKLPLAANGELHFRLVADEHWKRRYHVHVKDPSKGDKATRWSCSYGHDAKEGSSLSAELVHKLDPFQLLHVKASVQGRRPRMTVELRTPD